MAASTHIDRETLGGFRSFAGSLRNLLRADPRLPRTRVLLDYTRLRVRCAVRPQPGPRSISILGRRLTVPDLPAFTFLFEEIFLRGDYTVRLEGDAPVVIDAGANVGVAILYIRTLYPRARVIAYEPDPQVLPYLEANLESLGSDGIQVRTVALGSTAGKTLLTRARRHGRTGVTGRPDDQRAEGIEVDAVRLSEELPPRVDLLKLDVEGAELDVLTDLVTGGRTHSIEKMLIEFHHHIDDLDDRLPRLLNLLRDSGFAFTISADAKAGSVAYQDIMIRAHRREF